MAKRYEKNPNPQKPMTNVSTCRLRIGQRNFELACYPSKVLDFRQGVETDLDEVLQIERVFSNVQRGEVWGKDDLRSVFPDMSVKKVCEDILLKGQLQHSSLERSAGASRNLQTVLSLLHAKTVDPRTNRPHPLPALEEAVKKTGYDVGRREKKPKVMFLEIVQRIRDLGILPLERAKMLVKITAPDFDGGRMPEGAERKAGGADFGPDAHLFLMEPSLYREVDRLCKEMKWGVAVEKAAVLEEGEKDWDGEGAAAVRAGQEGGGGGGDDDEAVGEGDGGEARAPKPQQRQAPPPAKAPPLDVEAADADELGEPNDTGNMSTKDRKKAARKSKKAQRREREKEREVQERVEKERRRVEERKERLSKEGSRVAGQGECPLAASPPPPPPPAAQASSFKCNTCGGSWSSTGEHRAHYKSDWHRYNLKLKQAGGEPVTEAEFVEIDNDALFLGGG